MCDGPKVYSESYPISRKPHKCCECGGIIFFKEKYHRFSGIWEDRWDTYKTCMDCKAIREDYLKVFAWDEMPYLGELEQYIFDGGYKPDIKRIIEIKDRRGVKVQPWMREIIK